MAHRRQVAGHFLSRLRETKGYVLCLPHEHDDRCYLDVHGPAGPEVTCGCTINQAAPADVDEAALVKEFLER